MSNKRTIDSFFNPSGVKKPRPPRSPAADKLPEETDLPVPPSGSERPLVTQAFSQSTVPTTHPTYPWPIPDFPPSTEKKLEPVASKTGEEINDRPDLDLVYFQPLIPRGVEREIFDFLRGELFFYRVRYTINRGLTETVINTPRLCVLLHLPGLVRVPRLFWALHC